MRVGVTIFATDQTIDPVSLARAAEDRGFASLFLSEHTHLPVETLDPLARGQSELGEEYRRTLDPYVALAAASAATSTIRLGTAISIVAQHDPIVLAKQIATIDHLSGGRFVLGAGVGWNRQELADHGVRFEDRREVMREHLLAMQALWADDVASFDGRYVRFAPSYAWPKPVRGTIPTLVGGAAGPKLFATIAELADGWIPDGGAGLRASIPELRAAFEQAGRDPETAVVVAYGVTPSADKLGFLESLGVDEVVLRLPAHGEPAVLRALDEMAEHARMR